MLKNRVLRVIRLPLALLAMAAITLGVGVVVANDQLAPHGGAPPPGRGTVEPTGFPRVIDGDTLEVWLDDQQSGIGIIGVSAPVGNTPCGREASKQLRSLIKSGLILEEDPTVHTDDRGRRMYHAWTKDGRLVAEEQIKAGVARANDQGLRHAQRDRLAKAETEAKDAGRGCQWGAQPAAAGAGRDPVASLEGAITDLFKVPVANAQTPPPPTSLPAGFVQDVVASGLTEPTNFAFLPDGRILIAEKAGLIKVYKNGAVLATPVIDLRSKVNDYWDRGLIGLTVDPNFASNGYIYVAYVYENNGSYYESKTGRVSRLTMVGDTASLASELALLGTQNGAGCQAFPAGADCIPVDSPSHSAGNVKFGPDGNLYVTWGDGAQFNNVDPNALRAQDIDSLAGKMLRITPTGAGVSTNPFWNGNANANRSKVWTFGERNSFRFTLRPDSAAPVALIGDVGWGTWERIEVGTGGANMGWPCYEGNSVQAGYQAYAQCQSLYAANTFRPAIVAYGHCELFCGSTAVTGGVFYTGTTYPTQYQGAYFYGDYGQGFIRTLRLDSGNNLIPGSQAQFATNANGPVAFDMGPDQNLYYVAINNAELRRIRYAPTQPTAVASATPTSGLAPLTVQFSSLGSVGAGITYSWNFGDGTPLSTAANPQHTYTTTGGFTATLTVTTSGGVSNSATVQVVVGNRAPTPVITSPSPSQTYKVGDVITFSGSATDPEDGAIPASSLAWQIILHHCPYGNCHTHYFLNTTGASGSFTVPDHGDESYFEIILNATDSGAPIGVPLTGTTSVSIHPQTVQMTLNTVPTGHQVVYDGTSTTGPSTRSTVVNSTHTLYAPSQGNITFASWSDGGAQQHNVTVGPTNTTYTATFQTSCPCTIWNGTATPAIASYTSDTAALEVGMRFRSDIDGSITGVRFYKGAGNTGTHIGSLWSNTGTLLAQATFASETATGWQQVNFANPVGVTANTTYVVSYHMNNGGYARDQSFFLGNGVSSAPLRALADGADGANGVYLYSASSAFPTNSFMSTNYWVDPVFSTTIVPPPPPTPPVISQVQASGVGNTTATLTWQTDQLSDSQVEYGTSTSYGSSTPLNQSMVFNHSVPLTGLATGTQYHYRVKSKNGSAQLTTSGDFTFTTTSPPVCPCSIWPSTATPGLASQSDTASLEVGVKFRVDTPGWITGIRFYKGPANTGSHVGSLWGNTGQLLAQATFSGESATGWQQVSFSNAVQVTANTTYVASYHTSSGGYSLDTNYFASSGVDNGPLHALANGVDGPDGLYLYGPTSAFPTNSYASSNYWVDVVFSSTAPPPPSGPVISAVQATNVTGTGATITWTTDIASDSQVEYGPTITYGASTVVDASMVTSHSVAMTNLTGGTQYHYRVKSKDAQSRLTTSPDYVFSTPRSCPCSIWSSSATPNLASQNDTGAIEVGVKFRSDVAGWITGVRFYKGAANTGSHVGSLWSSTGQLLAQAVFSGETATGWQQVSFANAVQISPNTTYVASYHTNTGGYAVDFGAFSSAVDSVPLHALANGTDGPNGVYLYSPTSAFPTNTYNSSNYWVDVMLSTTAPPPPSGPVISSVQATNVTGTGASITWTTDIASDSQVEYGTTTSYGSSTPVNTGMVTSHSVALTGLAPNTPYHYRVKSKDAQNRLSTSGDFTFTTPRVCPCSIWNAASIPSIASQTDTAAIEVGVKFRSDVAGTITGIRFYKGPSNGGTHVGSLWSSTGQLLAQATFSGETATGWQQVTFTTPVTIQPNTTYIASYHMNSGGYSLTYTAFFSAVDNAPLHALSNGADGPNGVYAYSANSAFPTNTYDASNYWVDVVFNPQ